MKDKTVVIKHIPMSIAQYIALGGDVTKIKDNGKGEVYCNSTRQYANVVKVDNNIITVNYFNFDTIKEESIDEVYVTIAIPITELPKEYL